MAVRGILFDKDGTLIDCDLTWIPVLHRLAVELGAPGSADDMVAAAGLDPATGRLRAGSVWAAGSTLDLVRLWWPHAGALEAENLRRRVDAIGAEMSPATSVPLCDLAAFFDMIEARGIVAGIASNDSTASLRGFLKAQGLERRITHVIGYDSVSRPKPAPDMVHAFCRATGLVPAEIAVVGDNVHDLKMARAAGAGSAIGVLSGNGEHEDLVGLADLLVEGIEDLAGWLDDAAPASVAERACSTTRSKTGTA